MVKGTVVATAGRRPVWFEANPSGEGRTHDMSMLRAQLGLFAVLAATSATILADKSYQGLRTELGEQRVHVPRLRRRHQPKPPAQRDLEHAMSAAPMPVEHAVGSMKWWRQLRYWRRPEEAFDRAGKAIAILAGLT